MMLNSKIQIGVIGCGHWGPNHIRVFSALPNSVVKMAADPDVERLGSIAQQYPYLRACPDYQQVFSAADVDAVVIATPTQTHYELVRQALVAGKHVLCEKPLCLTANEGEELLALAQQTQRILMVGHIFLFNPGIVKLENLLQNEELGKLQYCAATRTNLGPIRHDVNVVYDLATHDIAICNFLLEALPVQVSAVGMCFLQPALHDVAFISLTYPEEIAVNLRVSWLDPKKVRQLTIVGDRKMATWDDLAEIGPVTIYDKGVLKEPYYSNYGEFQLLAREGDITIPKVKMGEPLKIQNQYFLACLERQQIERSDGRCGVDVVRVLSAITASMASGGRPCVVQ